MQCCPHTFSHRFVAMHTQAYESLRFQVWEDLTSPFLPFSSVFFFLQNSFSRLSNILAVLNLGPDVCLWPQLRFQSSFIQGAGEPSCALLQSTPNFKGGWSKWELNWHRQDPCNFIFLWFHLLFYCSVHHAGLDDNRQLEVLLEPVISTFLPWDSVLAGGL